MMFSFSFSQDTIYPISNDFGYFFVEMYDESSEKWTIKEYNNNTLFSIEELASNKHHSSGKYEGYYPDGKKSFLRECRFDGEFSEIHGRKEVYFPNGNLKEKGQYWHSIKVGNWYYFNENGERTKITQYNVPEIDTVTNCRYQKDKETFSLDTILLTFADTIPNNYFQSTFPMIDFGKNGIEVLYVKNKPIEVITYQSGKEMKRERNVRKIKQLIKTIE